MKIADPIWFYGRLIWKYEQGMLVLPFFSGYIAAGEVVYRSRARKAQYFGIAILPYVP